MTGDRTLLAGNLIRSMLKAKKLIQLYPANNMIYRNAVDEVYDIASAYLKNFGDIIFNIKPNEIRVDTEQVYQSKEKFDNFAMFFFREGVRELTFRDGLKKTELEAFIKLLGTDFSKEDVDDDFLFAAWERSFENIKLIVDDLFQLESEDSPDEQREINLNLQGRTEGELRKGFAADGADGIAGEKLNSEEKLQKAYREGLVQEETMPLSAGDLTGEERAFIVVEMQKDPTEKADKLLDILLIMLVTEQDKQEAEKIVGCIRDIVLYSLRNGSLKAVLAALKYIKQMEQWAGGKSSGSAHVNQFHSFCLSPKVINNIGLLLDSTKSIKDEEMLEFAWYFGKDAIGPLISLLENLQTMSGRRIINNVLIHLGKENISVLVAKLNDPVWYVVRNIIYVLRNIGDSSVQDAILGAAGHEHPRVRLEVLRALGDFGNMKALQAIKGFLDDRDPLVRQAAVTVLSSLSASSSAAELFMRDAIMEKIVEKGFEARDFKERKTFYEALASVRDREVEEYMIETLKKRTLFGGKKQSETKACAAYYLGMAGSKDALPLLEKFMVSSDPVLMEHASAAVERIRDV